MTNAIYIRTSTDEQNPENQIKESKSMIEGDFDLYTDKQSAWKEEKERPDFKNLKKQIKRRKIKDLYVWDLDRIYRNRIKLVAFFKFCKAYRCNIHSFRQNWLEELVKVPEPWNDILHDFMIQMMGWMAEEESNRKSRRVKAAIRIRQDGVYSYKGNKWGRKNLPKRVPREILEMHNLGLSIRKICAAITYTDKNNKPTHVSIGYVQKTIAKYKEEKDRSPEGSQLVN